MTAFGFVYEPENFAEGVKEVKEQCKILDKELCGKTYLVGQRFTLADIVCFNAYMVPFTLVLDAGFRKAMPNVSAWFERVSRQSAVINTCGIVRMCSKAIKPVDPSKVVAVELPKVEEKKTAAPAEEDEFDPFADESEEDEEAEKAKMARMKEIAKTAKSYGKAPVIAKSIIIFEVKPWGEETDLDALAKLILAIEMDGLFWKTEYKKEPIAYGVFKIVIGCVVEDDKVSTDILQESIEAFEDEVQSVDIQSFNKL